MTIKDRYTEGYDAVPLAKEGMALVGEYGKSILSARTREEMPLVSPVEVFLLDLWTWTGSQAIADGSWLNYVSLAGISKGSGGTAATEKVGNNLKFPVREGNTQVIFSVRISGEIAGGAGTSREWRTQTRRTDGITLVGSAASIKVQGTTIANRDIVLASYTLGNDDPFMVDGIQLGLHNISGQTITLTSIAIRVMQTINPV